MVLVAAGLAAFMVPGPDASYLLFLPGLVLIDVGTATLIPPLTTSALAVPEELSGVAAGVNNEVSRVAGLVAVAAMGAVMVTVFTMSLSTEIAAAGIGQHGQELVLERAGQLGNLAVPDTVADPATVRELVEDAFVTGFRWVMAVNIVVVLSASLVAVRYIHRK